MYEIQALTCIMQKDHPVWYTYQIISVKTQNFYKKLNALTLKITKLFTNYWYIDSPSLISSVA